MWLWFHKLSSPPYAYRVATLLRPWFCWTAMALMLFAAYGGLVLAPPDYQQKDAFRIIYVHAPAAIMSLLVYVVMAIAAAVGLIWRIKLAHAVAAACAPVGACVHGRRARDRLDLGQADVGHVVGMGPAPHVGADPAVPLSRLHGAARVVRRHAARRPGERDPGDRRRRECADSQYSVVWWNTLHQAPTISKLGKPSIALPWPGRSHDVARLYALLRSRAVRSGAQRDPPARAQCHLAARNRKDIMSLREFLAMGGYGGVRLGLLRRDHRDADLQRVVGAALAA